MQVGAIVVYDQVRFEAQMLAASSDASDAAVAPLRLDEQIFLAQLVFRAVRLNDAFHAAAASLLLAHGTVGNTFERTPSHDFTFQRRPSSDFRLELSSGDSSQHYLPSLVQRAACVAPDGQASAGLGSGAGMHHVSAKFVTPVTKTFNRMSSRSESSRSLTVVLLSGSGGTATMHTLSLARPSRQWGPMLHLSPCVTIPIRRCE